LTSATNFFFAFTSDRDNARQFLFFSDKTETMSEKYLDIAATNFVFAFTETPLDGTVSLTAEEHVIVHLSRDGGVGVSWKHVAVF